MNITRIITVLLLSAALVSCSEITTSLEEGSSRTETVVSEVSTVTNTAITSNNTITALTVKVISYQDGQLIYDHNGKKGNAALDREVLNQHKKYKVISIYERIIAECANEEIKANIKLDTETERVIYCDVYTPNGEDITNSFLDTENKATTREETEVSIRRVDGTVYEFRNSFGSFTADIAGCDNFDTDAVPDTAERCIFMGYRLNSGKILIDDLQAFYKTEIVNGREQGVYRSFAE